MSTNPEKELEEFLAPLPLYVQKSLWYDPSRSGDDLEKELFDEQHWKWPFSEKELRQFRSTSWQVEDAERIAKAMGWPGLPRFMVVLRGWQPSPPVKELRPQFERILKRIPSKWKLYRKNAKAWRERQADFITPIPKGDRGPKPNVEQMERILKLHSSKSYREIAKEECKQNRKVRRRIC